MAVFIRVGALKFEQLLGYNTSDHDTWILVFIFYLINSPLFCYLLIISNSESLHANVLFLLFFFSSFLFFLFFFQLGGATRLFFIFYY